MKAFLISALITALVIPSIIHLYWHITNNGSTLRIERKEMSTLEKIVCTTSFKRN